jgi:GNAT superfamily N-acetyltransferase
MQGGASDDELTVRDATQQDAAAVAELLGQLGYPSDVFRVRARLQQVDQAEDYGAYVGVLEGEIVGVASLHVIRFFEKDGVWCRLTALVVRDDVRGRGVGRCQVERVEEVARARRCGQVEVNSGDQRSDAHAFYEHMGYEQVSRRFRKLL